MGYREYARYLSYHFPFTHERSLLEHLRAAPWRFDQSMFKARAAPPGPAPPSRPWSSLCSVPQSVTDADQLRPVMPCAVAGAALTPTLQACPGPRPPARMPRSMQPLQGRARTQARRLGRMAHPDQPPRGCSALRAGVAPGPHGLPAGGCGPARAVEHRLDAQPLACRVRVVPGQEPAAALAVGPQALLGRAAGRRPGVRRARLAVRLRLPRRRAPALPRPSRRRPRLSQPPAARLPCAGPSAQRLRCRAIFVPAWSWSRRACTPECACYCDALGGMRVAPSPRHWQPCTCCASAPALAA